MRTQYVLVEIYAGRPKYTLLVTDENNDAMVFDSLAEAVEYSSENLQNGIPIAVVDYNIGQRTKNTSTPPLH